MKKQLNAEIGIRIRETRQQMGLSREELAKALDISVVFMGYIESGQKGMSLDTLMLACRTLHVTADYLLFGASCGDSSIQGEKTVQMVRTVEERFQPLLQRQIGCFMETLSAVAEPID